MPIKCVLNPTGGNDPETIISAWPSALYRYRSIMTGEALQREFDLLKNNFIWLSHPAEFNDPFDCLFIHDLPGKTGIDRIRDEILICSLSKNPHSVPMWSHYANNHQGICIEFPLTPQDRTRYPVLPVQYKYPRFDIRSLDSKKIVIETPPVLGSMVAQQEVDGTNVIPVTATQYKAEEWEYEEEWRYVATGTLTRSSSVDAEKRALEQYGPNYRQMAIFPKPSRIILGAKMCPVMKNLTAFLFAKIDIPTVQARLSDTEWEIEF